jgi:hypothetical protein
MMHTIENDRNMGYYRDILIIILIIIKKLKVE